MHVPVRCLLLPVQRLLQDKFCKFISVGLGLHVQVKVIVGCDIICAQRVGAHVRVERTLQREPGARGSRWVVVNVHHFNFDSEQLQWVLQEHLHVELAAGTLLADLLPIDFLINEQDAVLEVHFQIWRSGTRHYLESPGGQFGKVQPQVFSDVPHQRAMLCLLRDRVTGVCPLHIHGPRQKN
uniref:Uncharacterized protein n=1 Tax=Xiphophorus couchianus TaxID=32473 RepID=A0A3B5KRB1_9TELE